MKKMHFPMGQEVYKNNILGLINIMNTHKIPTTIVTGFLGSGKTTLLSSVLKQPGGRRIAAVVSVPAESGIDSEILRGTDFNTASRTQRLPLGNRIYELSNGCLCCAVQDDFVQMMHELIARRDDIDHVIIETPGTELPISFLRRLSTDTLAQHFTIDSVMTVADGPALMDGRHTSTGQSKSRTPDPSLQFLYQAQLDIADVVLISKTDLVFPVMRKKLQGSLEALLSHKPDIISMQHGIVSPDLLFGRNCGSEQRMEVSKIELDEHQGRDCFDTVMVTLGRVDSDLLVSRLQMLNSEQTIYRAKGFAELPNKMMRQVVQGVGSRIDRSYDRRWWPDEERSTRLQITGRHLDAERLLATLRVAEV